MKAQTKFYEFCQNNSGGHFDVDENVCHRVVIEATSKSDAIKALEPLIENQSSSCPCCGERWEYDPYVRDVEKYRTEGLFVGMYTHYNSYPERWMSLYGDLPRREDPVIHKNIWGSEYGTKIYFETIEQYYQYLANSHGWTTPDARIFFLDGSKKEIFRKNI